MLQIKDIRKKYVTGELVQTALDGVSLTLRDNEFVAVLGPSGSGKTTLLNVIGGLDRYDSGDLIINGISTRKYSDRDWDSYRNHTIGFVFQSYNLIPHQTVLANVELALTISGISRSQRRKRAVKALEDVGLGNQLHKRPNQMSGGQMQRVAIARALVNDPDILLADEPTGALDSETSVQVMELLKEVSRDRLVVMVTHNPELAEEYANRIVRVRDGRIIGDTNPYTAEGVEATPQHKNMGKARMSRFTALALSFNNLRTKKARTLLTAFAGSIGIIGIALILSISTGFQRYIDEIQADTLSNYPLTIQSETADMSAAYAMMSAAMKGDNDGKPGSVREQQMLTQMFANIGANDLGAFKAYLEENMESIGDAVNALRYTYPVKPLIYAADGREKPIQVNPGTLFSKLTGGAMMTPFMKTDVFQEMINNTDLLNTQYDILRGRWPERYNELVVVLAAPNRISDYMAYTLGLKDMDTLEKMMALVMSGQQAEPVGEPMEWTYEDLMALRFRLVPASQKYRYNAEYAVWEDMSGDDAYMAQLIGSGEELRVVGIVCPKEAGGGTLLSQGVAYTGELTRRVMEDAAASAIVSAQLADKNTDVFTGKPFDGEESGPKLNFEDMISIDGDMLSSAFGMNVDENAVLSLLEGQIAKLGDLVEADRAAAQKAFTDVLGQLAGGMLTGYIQENAGENGEAVLRAVDAPAIAETYLSGEEAQALIAPLVEKYAVSGETMTQLYGSLLTVMVTGYVASETPLTELPEEMIPTQPEVLAETDAEAATMPTEATTPELPFDPESFAAAITMERAEALAAEFTAGPVAEGVGAVLSSRMIGDIVRWRIENQISGFGDTLMGYFGNALQIDQEKIAAAFHFEMNEEDLLRLMQALSGSKKERTADTNLQNLGYADLDDPSAMAVYLKDFAAKERFMDFIDSYNERMEEAGQEEQVIRYTDVTGMMMSSVRTIIDSVSYVLIAFVAVSLVVSSIMIGIITYISVMERTKEIGVLRAIGASKRNISQVFNAETFIIGLCSGFMGVGVSLLLIIPINDIIHRLTEATDINAQLPATGAVILILLSVILTLIGGLIPSKKAARKDPVIALRSE